MGTTSISSAIFNGNSRYSADFQAVIDRTTAIASMPITQLQNQKTNLNNESTALSLLGDVFSKLQSAIDGINTSLSGSSYSADVSDPAVIGVTLGDGAMEGNYGIEVLDAGAFATSQTHAAWANDPGPVHNYSIAIGGHVYALSPADNSATGVAHAINAQYSDKVRATVVNVGSAATPDYRISLQAVALGDLHPDLLDGGLSMQDQKTQGVLAHYIVNDSGQDVFSASRSVTIATGIGVNLRSSDAGSPVNITVTRSSSALSNALQTFATAYNAAVDEVGKEYGPDAGVLSGQSVVGQLSQVLSRIATYTASGNSINGLTALGLKLDSSNSGRLNFNSLQFIAADITSSGAITSFLGDSEQGGFLKWATDSLNGVEAPTTGVLSTAQASVKSSIAEVDSSIADKQASVDRLKEQLQARMAAADALIASMEQQYNYLSNMFTAMQNAAQQYK